MPNEKNEIILSGTYQELKAQMTALKSIQVLLKQLEVNTNAIASDKDLPPKRKGKPKITLYFLEPVNLTPKGQDPLRGVISFRLMNEPKSNFATTDRAKFYAEKIKTKFGGTTPFLWQKGKIMYSYTDWEKGYQLQILAPNEAEAMRVIDNVLEIQSHSPDWDCFNIVTAKQPASRYSDVPEHETVMGERVELPMRRRVSKVRFEYATLSLPGHVRPFNLYDVNHKLPGTLVS